MGILTFLGQNRFKLKLSAFVRQEMLIDNQE